MKTNRSLRLHTLPMTIAAGVIITPLLAFAQTSTAPATTPAVPPAAVIVRPAAPAPMATAPAATAPSAQVATLTSGSAVMARPRMSQIIGASVYNDRNEKIGEVEDILLAPPAGAQAPMTTPSGVTSAPASVPAAPGQASIVTAVGQGPVAIIQVGGFLGMGGRLVSVSLTDLRWNGSNEHIVLPGATVESLRGRPAFEFAMLRPR